MNANTVNMNIVHNKWVLVYRLVVFKFIQFCIALSSAINILILIHATGKHSVQHASIVDRDLL